MSRGLKRIPKIKLSIEDILRRAESTNDLVTYASDLSGVGYVTDLSEVLIVTRCGGYLRLPIEIVTDIMQELEYVSEDAERRRRD